MKNNLQRVCLVHYHEIGLKGRNRGFFENRLKSNISSICKSNNFPIKNIFKISGRICIFLNEDIDKVAAEEIYGCISKIPGCARVSCGFKCEQSIEAMIKAGCIVMDEAGQVDSFKVSARRNHTSFEYDSMQINQLVGGKISDAFPNVKVKMKNPTLDIKLEVIEGSAYVYGTSIVGVGGLPVGTSGKVVGLLSSGIDSPVALWKLARRGARIVGVHFSGAPIVSDESEYLVREIGDVFNKSGCIHKIYIIRIGEFQKQIAQSSPEKLRIILYRRLMYKIAEEVAELENAGALITGESLGQVASQTIENLAATNNAVDIQVFRPLIGSDKQEIIDLAQKIGTFDISSHQAPDCCTLYMPKNPETHANIKFVKYAEEDFDYKNWISQAIKNAKVICY